MLQPDRRAEVHGLAFKMSADAAAKLDYLERVYFKNYVQLEAYDGRKLNGFVYRTVTVQPQSTLLPSKRYSINLAKYIPPGITRG